MFAETREVKGAECKCAPGHFSVQGVGEDPPPSLRAPDPPGHGGDNSLLTNDFGGKRL